MALKNNDARYCISKTIYFSRRNGWMDDAILGPFDSILVITGRWESGNERLCEMEE